MIYVFITGLVILGIYILYSLGLFREMERKIFRDAGRKKAEDDFEDGMFV